MAKKLNEWLDEFVENGADASDVTEWPENAGGGGSGDFVGFKEGSTITVNLNTDFFITIESLDPGYTNTLCCLGFYLQGGIVKVYEDNEQDQLGIAFTLNEAKNQLLCCLSSRVAGGETYQWLTDFAVVAEGDFSNIQDGNYLSDIAEITTLPESVVFAANENLYGRVLTADGWGEAPTDVSAQY